MKKNVEISHMADDRSYCSTAEAARSLGVSIRTIQLWVDGGFLAAWKTAGGHRRILLDSVDRLRTSAAVTKLEP